MEEKKEEIKYEYVKKKKRNWVLPLAIVLLVGLVFGYFFFVNDVELPKPTEEEQTTENNIDDNFVTGLRLAALERYGEAISYFDKVRYNKLDESDKEIVVYAYIMAGEEQRALDLNPESDVEVIKKLHRFNESKKLLELETESELIEFEVAILEQDYEKIIDYKNIERLELDARIANEISNAYYELGEKEEAVNFTSLMTFDDINVWNNEWTGTPRVETQTEVVTKNSIIYTLLILVLLGLNLFTLYAQYSNGLLFKKRNVDEKDENNESGTNIIKHRLKKRQGLLEGKNKGTEVAKEDETNEKYSYHFDE